MFRILIRRGTCLGVLALLTVSAAAQGRAGLGRQQAKNRGNGICLIQSMPLQSLEAPETAGLLQMREEEKLARDVYKVLYSAWSDPVFSRIAESEQRHMDAVGMLLNRYGLEDPVSDNGFGEFSNPDLQVLYGDLTALGRRSHSDALKVGATIEDLDLYDLALALDATDKDDIRIVYGNLQRGSRNHMQAFVRRLSVLGETYPPQHINEAELASILESPQNASGAFGRGKGRGRRNGRGMCLKNSGAASD